MLVQSVTLVLPRVACGAFLASVFLCSEHTYPHTYFRTTSHMCTYRFSSGSFESTPTLCFYQYWIQFCITMRGCNLDEIFSRYFVLKIQISKKGKKKLGHLILHPTFLLLATSIRRQDHFRLVLIHLVELQVGCTSHVLPLVKAVLLIEISVVFSSPYHTICT
jgi:hypothetical protein